MVSQEKKERENGFLVCICFETRELGWLLNRILFVRVRWAFYYRQMQIQPWVG